MHHRSHRIPAFGQRSQLTVPGALAISLILSVFATLVVLAPSARAQGASPVRISEFVASNSSGLTDATGAHEDWIEFENTSAVAIDIGGWTINDSNNSFTFAAGTLVPAGGYLVVFASGDVSRTTASEIHLPLKLSASGEPLTLVDDAGTLTEPSWPVAFPALPSNTSLGIDASGEVVLFLSPTPAAPNTAGGAGIVEEVTMSVPHGYYTAPFALTLDTPTPSTTIRYTTDATTPTETNGTTLTPGQSITIDDSTMVRAVAFRSGWISSEASTATYLFAADVISQTEATPAGFPADADREHRYDYGFNPTLVAGNEAALAASLTEIPTISLVADPDNLFGLEGGIYENSLMSGSDWERPTSVEYFDPSSPDPGFTIDAGLRLRGTSTRYLGNPKHSFQVRFRDDYDGELNYPLFDDPNAPQSFEALAIGTTQHGSWHHGAPTGTHMRDIWTRRLHGDMGQPYTHSDYVHLFLNGQYWGIYFTQERVTNQFASDYLGGDESDYDIMTSVAGKPAEARDGSADAWNALWPLVSDTVVDDTEFVTLAAEVDFESLADYYVLHFFTGERDGPPVIWGWHGARWAGSNNWRAVRDRTGVGDGGKWHFIDHDSEISVCLGFDYLDLDGGAYLDNTPPWNLHELLDETGFDGTLLHPGVLHEALLTRDEYRRVFVDRVYHHMVRSGGVLTVSEATANWEALRAENDPFVDIEAARWGDAAANQDFDRSDWQIEVDRVRDCIEPRWDTLRSQLIEDALWPAGAAPTIGPASATIEFGDSATITTTEPGTLYVTLDGSDPALDDGTVNPTATVVTGPVTVTDSLTLKARTVDNGVWSPLASQSYTVVPPAGPTPLVLNEWNAVSASNVIANGDSRLGSVVGNGGDWFELVVTQDRLDVRGWQLEIHDDAGQGTPPTTLTFTNDPLLADLRAGTILTVAHDLAIVGEGGDVWQQDASYWPEAGDWWIHLVAGPAGDGQYLSTADFAVTHQDWQLTIRDDQGVPRFGPAGEGTGTLAGGGIGNDEVGELEADPGTATSAASPYGDGNESTFGEPNLFAAQLQDLATLRPVLTAPGDVNCDSTLDIADALVIAQYVAGARSDAGACPLSNPSTTINAPAGDVDRNGVTTNDDAQLILQCLAGLDSQWCSSS